MKFALFAVCVVAALTVASAASDAGHFIPKAFYKLNANGIKSDLHPVSPHTAHYLRRLRRQTFSSSSSSSSSSSAVSANGGPVFFTSQQVTHNSAEPSFASRFGGETPAKGHIVQTTGVIDEKGHVYYNKKEGHF